MGSISCRDLQMKNIPFPRQKSVYDFCIIVIIIQKYYYTEFKIKYYSYTIWKCYGHSTLIFTLKSSDICVTPHQRERVKFAYRRVAYCKTPQVTTVSWILVVNVELVGCRRINAQVRYVCSSLIYHNLLICHINTQRKRKKIIKFSSDGLGWFKYVILSLSGTRKGAGSRET